MRYRRSRFPGGTYFFTVNLADRSGNLLVANVHALRAAVRQVTRRHPFQIRAMVVLPEHLHAIWTLPVDDADYPMRWNLIKAAFSRQLENTESVSDSRKRRGERGIWQRRYWEHLIRDDEDLATHIDYIHLNPVKHGYVKRAADWPHSSIHRFVSAGILPIDWAGQDDRGEHGEPRER